MTADRWIVTASGLALIALIVWFFWLKRSTGFRATEAGGGYQEAIILVKGGSVRLARSEEREALVSFGEAYRKYMKETPGFIPRVDHVFGRSPSGSYSDG